MGIIIIIRPHCSAMQMWHIVTDGVACLSLGRSVTFMSPAKTAEPIQMPYGMRTLVVPSYCCHLANMTELPCAAMMRPYVKLLLSLVRQKTQVAIIVEI